MSASETFSEADVMIRNKKYKEREVKRLLVIICMLAIVASTLVGCGKKKTNAPDNEERLEYTFQDSEGNKVTVTSIDSVVALYGSFAELWLDAGGSISGTTEDAIDERKLQLGEDVKMLGTVKEPNLEEIIALNPTLVLLSADVSGHSKLRESLVDMGIPCAMMRVDTFKDYLDFLKIACDMTGREDMYKKNGLDIEARIKDLLAMIPKDQQKTVLFLRAYSTGAKAKTDDNFTGVMLQELGTINIASKHPSLLEELSIEEIIIEDPEYIFVTTMGSEEKALKNLKENVESNPAWSNLQAVKNGNYIVLPKDLFHYKPNDRWAESYEYLVKILYPELKK